MSVCELACLHFPIILCIRISKIRSFTFKKRIWYFCPLPVSLFTFCYYTDHENFQNEIISIEEKDLVLSSVCQLACLQVCHHPVHLNFQTCLNYQFELKWRTFFLFASKPVYILLSKWTSCMKSSYTRDRLCTFVCLSVSLFTICYQTVK